MDDCPKPVRNMEHNLVSRSSRQKKTSNAMKEKALVLEAHQNSKFKEKKDNVAPFPQPCIDQHSGLKHQIDDEHMVQLKSPGNSQKQQLKFKTKREDEFVKHMSNLPAFLQRVEKQKNVQEKALNFGVLDWKRLEKWKYNERMPVRGHRKISSISNSLFMPSVSPRRFKTSLQRKQASDDLHLNSSIEVRLPNCVQDFQAIPLRTVDKQQSDSCQKVKFSTRSHSRLHNNDSKKVEADQNNAKEKVVLSSKQVKMTSSLSSLRTTDHHGRRKTTTDDGTNLCPKYPADEPEHIVLLVPKLPSERSSSQNLLAESRTSCNRELAEDYQKRLADCYSSQELHSGESYDEIPHSCPLPASVSISRGMQSDICSHQPENGPPITARPDSIKCQETKKYNGDCSVSVETFKGMGFDTSEQSTVNGRRSSPNRRFSFSLGRLSRSFSFKESSAVPQLSSTCVTAKSGPVSSEVLASIDDKKVDKAQAGGRGQSSPFRRLLHPILKPKGAHSAHPVQPLQKDLHLSISEPLEAIRPLQDETHQKSTSQALLEFRIKNGLPFFKFVVGDSSDILAATVRNLPKSGKADCSFICRFYSVREIKKKAGVWIGHASKDKSCSFRYNIVGQMKISSLSGTIREAVLYNVHIGQGDKGSPEVLPNQEIAAILVKDPAAKLDCKEQKEKCKEKGLVWCSPGFNCDRLEKENFDDALVILPGDVHGLPNEGVPSSLIDRWKSGGLCDCGGWDIGCKLRLLSNHKKESNGLTPASGCSEPERVDLFNQGGEGRSQPSFSLVPLKDGYYSVEFNASIPLLEAFSICVAAVTNQKLPHILDTNLLPEAKVSAQAITKNENAQNQKISGQVPAKYVQSPPPSPVGRI